MKENKIDVFIINRTDEFLNEYIASYAERLNWISNFSGSSGRAIIETDNAFIFVDGRYTNQANQEVNKTYFDIKHIESYWNHIQNYSNSSKKILIDPSLHSINEVQRIKNIFQDSSIKLDFLQKNPIDQFWSEQPDYPNASAFLQSEKYSGENFKDKIKKIQNNIQSNFIDFYILSSLDSIAWLLNIRGDDLQYTPLLFCYAIIPNRGKIELFVDKEKIEEISNKIIDSVNFHSFDKIETYINNINNINNKKIIGMDEKTTPYILYDICKNRGLTISFYEDPCLYPKAIKNKTELDGARKANLRDGVSISKFLYWLKNEIEVDEIDELKAADYLLNLRKKNQLFHSPSFETVSAVGSNAALPHYRVNEESNKKFQNNSLYLVDSGAQYRDGTTDITRTIIIGKPTQEQKDRFTRVLKGHIAVAEARFLINAKSSEIDFLARKSLKEINCDYDHGTGHGIGSFLSVHEGPQRITKSSNSNNGVIKQGMILSNEPGFYKEGEYGIRIENLVICHTNNKNHLYFETISWAPIERDLIDNSMLSEKEIFWLNDYHREVYEKIGPYINKKELEWLANVTSPLSK